MNNTLLLLNSKNSIQYIGNPKNISIEDSLSNLLENKEITEAFQIKMNKHNFSRFLKYISELNNFLTNNFIKESILYQPNIMLTYKKILNFVDDQNTVEEFCDIRYTVIMKDTGEFENSLLTKTDKEFQNLKNQLGSYFNLKLLPTKIIEDSTACDHCGDTIEHEHPHFYNQFSSTSICHSCDSNQMNNPKRVFPFNTIYLKYKNKKILKELVLDYYNLYKIKDKSYFAKDGSGGKYTCTVCTMPLWNTENDVYMSLIHLSNCENQNNPMFICFNCSIYVLNQDKLDKLAITSNFLHKKYCEEIKKNNIDTHNLVFRRIKVKEIVKPVEKLEEGKSKEGKARKREIDREHQKNQKQDVNEVKEIKKEAKQVREVNQKMKEEQKEEQKEEILPLNDNKEKNNDDSIQSIN